MLIVDTDPGIDDMLALLLLMATPKNSINLGLISLTYGNCSLRAALRNALSMFWVIQQEERERELKNLPKFTDQRPAICTGSTEPLLVKPADAAYIHGNDGLGGIHKALPEYSCPEDWVELFSAKGTDIPCEEKLPFIVERKPSWKAILDILRREPRNSVTILSIGPLTNLSRAATMDPDVFRKVKQIVVMGGAVRSPGNVTPVAEFNVSADPEAAAAVFAMSSRMPELTWPASLKIPHTIYDKTEKPIDLVLVPLDITTKHTLTAKTANATLARTRQLYPDAPLPRWIEYWLDAACANYQLYKGEAGIVCELHDPLAAAFVLNCDPWLSSVLDVRVETLGQWSRGQTIGDLRELPHDHDKAVSPYDPQGWLGNSGNFVRVLEDSPFRETFGTMLMNKILYGTHFEETRIE